MILWICKIKTKNWHWLHMEAHLSNEKNLFSFTHMHCIAMCSFHQLLGFKQVILMRMCIQMILVQSEIMIHWPYFIHSLWIPQLTAWLVLTVYFFSGGLATHWCSCWLVFYHLLKYRNLSLYIKSQQAWGL